MQRVRRPLDGLVVDGQLLYEARITRDLTQAVVADRARISAQWLRRIERHGQQPGQRVAEDIAAALGCALTDICVPVAPQRAA